MKKILLFIFVIGLLFSACNNKDTETIPVNPKFTDLEVPAGFKFETTRLIDIDLEVKRSEVKEPPHKFFIYNGNPNDGGKLITSGMTDPYMSFETKVIIPAYLTELHIRKLDVNGNIETITADATGNSIYYEFSSNKSEFYSSFKGSNVIEDPGCGSCQHEISGSHQNLTLDSDVYCVVSGSSLTVSNLKLENGAKLIICGVGTITNITPQGQGGGSIYVSTGGILYSTNVNTNKLNEFVNYGQTFFSNHMNIHSTCTIENHDFMNFSGNTNNSSSNFVNYGNLQVAGGFNNNKAVYNLGQMSVSGHFNNNGGPDVELFNLCKLVITGDFNQNSYFYNSSFTSVGQNTRFNGGSTVVMEAQALITTNTLHVDGLLEGPSVPCAKIDIADETRINGSGEVNGYMDICDANGIDSNSGTIGDDVTFDCSCYIAITNCSPGSGEPDDDTDGDGCPDDQDDYPDDPERCSNEYYPNETDFTNLAFEDLWNSLGDYDFNDLIVETNYKIVKNGQNKIVEVFGKFHIAAVGADLNNGFAIEFETPVVNFDTVIGAEIHGSVVSINDNGTEQGPLNKAVVVVFDAVNGYLGTSMVNTIPGGNYMDIDTITVYMKFVSPLASVGTPPYNPFMFINQTRGKEIHLIDHAPSELVDVSYFGIDADNSIPEQGRYYVTSNNLPWVIEIPQTFDYPIETVDILNAHLKFREWAESAGTLYPDWYENKSGYRNEGSIYQKPN